MGVDAERRQLLRQLRPRRIGRTRHQRVKRRRCVRTAARRGFIEKGLWRIPIMIEHGAPKRERIAMTGP